MPRRAPSPSSRRRSSLPSQPSTPRASLTHPTAPRQPKLGVLAAAANRLRDVTATPRRSVSGRAAPGEGEREAAPLVVESQRYEEWMKIATDNKITSTNTWNLALIDYFHDMSLLRNGDDNSINFQKASCTLDGCVKIWTSRVDSVASETGKLLSGLGDKAAVNGEDEGDEEDGDGEEDAERQEKRARKRAARQTSTLADDFSRLRIKAFDLEFTVDPLFKKTSADFDEGGAGGILMNHLGCDGNMKVVFDAGDAKLECDDEEGEEGAKKEEDVREEEGDVEVDISRLRARCLPSGLSPLQHMSLCPSLSAFRFSADSSLSLGMLHLGPDSDSDAASDGGAAEGGEGDFGGFDDHFAGQEFGGGGDDFGGGGGEGEVDFFADQFTPLGAAELGLPIPGPGPSGSGSGGVGFGPIEPFDPRLASSRTSDLVLSNTEDAAEEGANVWELLDQRVGGKKGWAGPEHWKMRRGRIAGGGAEKAGGKKEEGEEDDAPAGPDAKPTRAKKDRTALVLDFSSPPPLSSKELFLPAAPKSSITTSLNKKKTDKAEEDWTLPEDYMFSSGMLLRLFLKPKTTLRMRRRPSPSSAGLDPSTALGGTNEAGAADVQFWAQAGGVEGDAMQMEGDMGGLDPMDHDFGGGPDNDDDDPPPFDTQWLVSGDADDLPDPDADIDTDANLPDDLAAATQGQLRRVRPEQVTYAKRAKRVDVKKLKDSIWKELEEVVVPVKQFPAAHVYDPTAPPPEPITDENVSPASAARPKKPKKSQRAEALVPVISSLRKQYPKEKMDEISTSYLFICLLHLANEKGLRIQTPKPASEGAEEVGVEEGEEMRKLVGGLEGLRVLKEVQA
ncbi:hypothetical protein JCM10049v2_007558 [Rhodotorula toruloides]